MSIRAMNWAMGARTDGVSAQCVLFVVADTANEHGVSVHADPDYIAERTRQSRATVFRRLNELENAGALTRFKRYRDDGAPIYEIRLHLDRQIDYTEPQEGGDDPQAVEAKSQIETAPESQIETGKVSPVRQAESHSCDSKSPSKNPKDSPQAPLRGVAGASDDDEGAHEPQAPPEGWDAFRQAFEADGVPIARVSLVKPLFGALSATERIRVTTAARGYLHHRSREKKPGTKLSAQNFVREIESWDGWIKLAPAAPVAPVFVRERSAEFRAMLVLARILGDRPPEPRFEVEQGEAGVWRRGGVPPDLAGLAAFADKPDQQWAVIEEKSQPFAAWSERIRTWTGHRLQAQRVFTGEEKPFTWNGETTMVKQCVSGTRVPCLYPPRKDGTVADATGPPPG